MGCAASSDCHDEESCGGTDYISARLGLAMLQTIQANKAAAALAGNNTASDLQQELAQTLIRKAKNDGCTVSIVNGGLYIDYKYVGQLPPECV